MPLSMQELIEYAINCTTSLEDAITLQKEWATSPLPALRLLSIPMQDYIDKRQVLVVK